MRQRDLSGGFKENTVNHMRDPTIVFGIFLRLI